MDTDFWPQKPPKAAKKVTAKNTKITKRLNHLEKTAGAERGNEIRERGNKK